MHNTAYCSVLLMALVGCGPVTQVQNPLVDPQYASAPLELYGCYRVENPSSKLGFVHLGAGGPRYPKGFLKVICVSEGPDGLMPFSWPAFVARLDDDFVLHLPIPVQSEPLKKGATTESLWSKPWDETPISGYALMRIRRTENGLLVSNLDEAFLAEQVKLGRVAGTITNRTTQKNDTPGSSQLAVLITATQDELQEFFSHHRDEAFGGKPMRLRNCSSPIDHAPIKSSPP